MKYFVISSSDGDTYIESINKDELIRRFTPEDGCTYYGERAAIATLEKEICLSDRNGVLIIKGEIVSPRPVTVVKTVDFD